MKIVQSMAVRARTMPRLKFPKKPMLSLMAPDAAIPKQKRQTLCVTALVYLLYK